MSDAPNIPDEVELLRVLNVQNPWWSGRPVPPSRVQLFKRRDFYKVRERLSDEKIVAITGARRVGKTTLMYQLIEDLLTKVSPKRILYLSLDDPYLGASSETLMRILDMYGSDVLSEPLNELKEQVYIFFDEVQYIGNWASIVKRWFDLRARIKFILSGSSSLQLTARASETLVGRLTSQVVLPVKFLEVLRFKTSVEFDDHIIHPVNRALREALKEAVTRKRPELFYSATVAAAKALVAEKDRWLAALKQYFLKGGYPELLTIDDLSICAERLREYLNLTLYRDILRVGRVRDPEVLEALVAFLAKNSSQRINRTGLAKTLGLDRHTLNTYLFLLKSVYLISDSEFYSESRAKRARREKKIYIDDVGIRNTMAGPLDESILQEQPDKGSIAETVVFDHARRLKYNLEPGSRVELYYWRNSGYETDIVLELSRVAVPIEVKYTNRIHDLDIRGIQHFLDDNPKSSMGLVVTNDLLERRGKIVLIPCWLFLTMC